MNKLFLKPCLAALGATIGLASVVGIAQDTDDIERKIREMNIMDNIFEAAMEENNGQGFNFRQTRRPDSMYLAGQGMVFSFRILNNRPVRISGQGFGEGWAAYMNEMMELTRASLERVERSFPDLDLDFDFDEDFDINFSDEPVFIARGQRIPQAPQSPQGFFFLGADIGPDREAMREMQEVMRDTQEEIRDQQREVRDLQRELRDDDADIASVEARISQIEENLDAEMARLDEQQQAYESFVMDLENVRNEQQLALAEESSSQIIETLCDYGATLRSLDSNEHVTVILEDAMDNINQIFVFDFADIQDCTDAEELKINAVSYQLSQN